MEVNEFIETIEWGDNIEIFVVKKEYQTLNEEDKIQVLCSLIEWANNEMAQVALDSFIDKK